MDSIAVKENTKIVCSRYYTHVLPRLEEVYKWLCQGGIDMQTVNILGTEYKIITKPREIDNRLEELGVL